MPSDLHATSDRTDSMSTAAQGAAIRAVAVLGGVAAFIVAAAMVQPDWVRADEPIDASSGDLHPVSGPHRDGGEMQTDAPASTSASLGTLEGRRGRIELVATADGPKYRPLDLDGRVIATGAHPAGLDAAELDALDAAHGLPAIGDAVATEVRLMRVDPGHAWMP